jgi:hypothetical protein
MSSLLTFLEGRLGVRVDTAYYVDCHLFTLVGYADEDDDNVPQP